VSIRAKRKNKVGASRQYRAVGRGGVVGSKGPLPYTHPFRVNSSTCGTKHRYRLSLAMSSRILCTTSVDVADAYLRR
jgi:hypothetical protein